MKLYSSFPPYSLAPAKNPVKQVTPAPEEQRERKPTDAQSQMQPPEQADLPGRSGPLSHRHTQCAPGEGSPACGPLSRGRPGDRRRGAVVAGCLLSILSPSYSSQPGLCASSRLGNWPKRAQFSSTQLTSIQIAFWGLTAPSTVARE